MAEGVREDLEDITAEAVQETDSSTGGAKAPARAKAPNKASD
jgi:hypothetical protein